MDYRSHKKPRQQARRIYVKTFGEIPKGYEIHHLDGNRYNNAINNLCALPKEFHRKLHGNISKPRQQARRIYVKTFGEIPKGYEIHHLDGNRYNNTINNLCALPGNISPPASSQQKGILEALGINYDKGINRSQAGKLIHRALKEDANNVALVGEYYHRLERKR